MLMPSKQILTGMLILGAAVSMPAQQQLVPVTQDEATHLTYMREEEKLARDVYRFLAAKWNLRIFTNIAQSEENHFRQVGTLLERYGVPDPAAGRAAGEFLNPKLATLYTDLTAKGALSVRDALEVGVLIENTDIADLETGLGVVQKLDIKRVLRNLLSASGNHLDSFETVLEAVARAS